MAGAKKSSLFSMDLDRCHDWRIHIRVGRAV